MARKVIYRFDLHGGEILLDRLVLSRSEAELPATARRLFQERGEATRICVYAGRKQVEEFRRG
jgi:hypothetical protein